MPVYRNSKNKLFFYKRKNERSAKMLIPSIIKKIQSTTHDKKWYYSELKILLKLKNFEEFRTSSWSFNADICIYI